MKQLRHITFADLRAGQVVEVDGHLQVVTEVGPGYACFGRASMWQRLRLRMRRHIQLRGFWSRVWTR